MSLLELSPQDNVFITHKRESLHLSEMLMKIDIDKGYRMRNCCKQLCFAVTEDGLKLRQSKRFENGRLRPVIKFCHVRACLVCQWRKSLIWKSRGYRAIAKLIDDYPPKNYSLLLVTLTIRNPKLADMRKSIDAMNAAFRKMVEPYKYYPKKKQSAGNRKWQAIGWVKAAEISAGNLSGHCHPHLHTVLLMPNSYFHGENYMHRSEWQAMWGHYMKLDYEPQVDIREIKGDWREVVPEVFKYQVKGADLLSSIDFLDHYINLMDGHRSIEPGGVFRTGKYFKDLAEPQNLADSDDVEDFQENLININETLAEDNAPLLYYTWGSEVTEFGTYDTYVYDNAVQDRGHIQSCVSFIKDVTRQKLQDLRDNLPEMIRLGLVKFVRRSDGLYLVEVRR